MHGATEGDTVKRAYIFGVGFRQRELVTDRAWQTGLPVKDYIRFFANIFCDVCIFVVVNHTVGDITVDFTWARDRLFDKNACEAILDICKENPRATVESKESKEKSKWRPLPLDTVVSVLCEIRLLSN